MVNFRATHQSDLKTIEEWIDLDPDHRGKMDADFFYTIGVGMRGSCFAIEDERGPVIFVRTEAEGLAARLHTQFPPGSRKRVVSALGEAYPLVAADAKKRGFKEIRFESGSIALVRFMFKFGFRAELRASLEG